jgi:hypothetical protein
MSDLPDHEIKSLLQTLQHDLAEFPEGMDSLEAELESAAKHVPAYLKIVKSHIEQLRKVLELENHNHRTLENAGLTAPVQQLIKLFNTLDEADITLLEELATAARNWHSNYADDAIHESALESEATT